METSPQLKDPQAGCPGCLEHGSPLALTCLEPPSFDIQQSSGME